MKNCYFFMAILLLGSCNNTKSKEDNKDRNVVVSSSSTIPSIQDKIENLRDSHNKEILVVAHRGDWRNAPENSILAISNSIKMGVDMVEIDIHETKDGHLVLMHDDTIGRTTTGRGFVKDWTLDSLKTLRLKDGLGVPTDYKIPTLEEALLTTKDKILVNLDKSYDIFDKCFEIVKRTETLDQVIIKGGKLRTEVESEFGEYLDKVIFMPIIWPQADSDVVVKDYLKNRKPVAIEFIIPKDTVELGDYFSNIREQGTSVWVNSLWSHLSGNHHDDKALEDISTYQWYIDNNIDIIQTDRPELLLKFLRSKGLHD